MRALLIVLSLVACSSGAPEPTCEVAVERWRARAVAQERRENPEPCSPHDDHMPCFDADFFEWFSAVVAVPHLVRACRSERWSPPLKACLATASDFADCVGHMSPAMRERGRPHGWRLKMRMDGCEHTGAIESCFGLVFP